MAEKTEIEADPSAEKAYAAAAEAVSVKPEPAAAPAATPTPPAVEFPSKAKRAAAPKPADAARPSGVKASKPAKPKPASRARPVAAKAAVKAKPKNVAAKAKSPAKPVSKIKPIPAVPAAKKTSGTGKTVFQQLKDKTMDTAEFTTKMKSAVADVQVKAKEALDKGAAAFDEYNEFSKGNLEAVVESGKILATGMQSLGSAVIADTKSNFETLTAEVKELVSVKSPADFFKLQAAFARRNFDLAVAQTSKNSEAVLKLANEVAAPISSRVSLAVEKIKKAA